MEQSTFGIFCVLVSLEFSHSGSITCKKYIQVFARCKKARSKITRRQVVCREAKRETFVDNHRQLFRESRVRYSLDSKIIKLYRLYYIQKSYRIIPKLIRMAHSHRFISDTMINFSCHVTICREGSRGTNPQK